MEIENDNNNNYYSKPSELTDFNLVPDEPKKPKSNKIKYSTTISDPPLIITIQGGHSSGKSTLIKSLVKYYTNQNINTINGTITVRNSKNQRITFIECNNDICSLDDCSKITDVAVCLIDCRVGFEMETFEFISLLKNHGFTSIIGILTHMDDFKKNKSLNKYKKQIKKRFLKDATDKSKIYYLFGVKNNLYIRNNLQQLARHLKSCKVKEPLFRKNHPYILCDRYEISFLKNNNNDDNNKENENVLVSFYGYVRGNHFNKNVNLHINGLGDYNLDNINNMDDPCPIEIVEKNGQIKRTLKQKDKTLYAPYCNVNTLEYDRKSGYINIPEKLVTFTKNIVENEELANDEGVKMVRNLQDEKGNIERDFDMDLELIEGVDVKKTNDNNNKKIKEKNNNNNEDNLNENFILKNKSVFENNNTFENKLMNEIYNNSNESDDNIINDILNGDDILDTYKDLEQTDNNKDLNFLIKNCKSRFVTGATFELESNEEEEDENKNENKNEIDNNKLMENNNELTEEQKEEKLQNELKPFLLESSKHGLFQFGSYIRIDIKNIKLKHAKCFNPNFPLILSSLELQENTNQMGFLKIKFSKHFFYPKILKSNDPIILSIGWRRFQTTMIYCIEDKNQRLRMIKYTPKFTSCFGICYAPYMQINIAIVAFQNNFKENVQNFRICGTGDLIEINQSFNLVKKLKLIGYPEEIYKKSANIKNMFNSNLEVARYIGAKIQTVSGIRGIIKKQLNSKPEGRFRATFEDKIIKSDIIFLKTWTNVEMNKFYNPIVNNYFNNNDESNYLRTMAELRRDYGIELKNKKDSEYKEIVREEKIFPHLVISKNLEKSLPFKNKNKNNKKLSDEAFHLKKLGLPYKKKIKSYLTENEKKITSMLQRLETLKNIGIKNDKKGKELYEQKVKKEEEKKLMLMKKRKREKMINNIKNKYKKNN